MKNYNLMEMTIDIVKTMVAASTNYYPNEESAKELTKVIDTVYNKLVDLAEKPHVVYPKNNSQD